MGSGCYIGNITSLCLTVANICETLLRPEQTLLRDTCLLINIEIFNLKTVLEFTFLEIAKSGIHNLSQSPSRSSDSLLHTELPYSRHSGGAQHTLRRLICWVSNSISTLRTHSIRQRSQANTNRKSEKCLIKLCANTVSGKLCRWTFGWAFWFGRSRGNV